MRACTGEKHVGCYFFLRWNSFRHQTQPRFINNCLQESKRLNDLRGEHHAYTYGQRENDVSSGFFCFVFLLSHNSKTSWCIYFSDMSTKEGDTCQWQISIIFEYLKKKTTKLFPEDSQAQLCLTRPDPISSGTPFQASNKTRSKWIEKNEKKRKRGWRNDWIRALTLSNYFFFFFVSIGSSNMRVFLYSSFRNFRRDFYFRTWTGWNRPPETKWKRRKIKDFLG